MRILVQTHDMGLGGSQFNAVELADAVRALGHEVVLFGPAGGLVDEVHRRGLEYVLAPPRRGVPDVSISAALCRLTSRRRFDVLHTYEWNTLLDTMYGPGWWYGTPVLATVFSVDVPFFLPRDVPMLLCNPGLLEAELRRRPDARLLDMPIDTELNAPGAAPTLSLPDGSQTSVRAHLGIAPDERLIVVASRISSDLKLEGLLEAVAVMPRVDARVPARLVVVGDGPERPSLERAVEAARGSDGRATTILAGAYADPRPFYEAADLVIGMGSSILRGMAFDKPAVVQGVQGYWESVSAETVTTISRHGWYGVGDGRADLDRLARLITDALRWPNPGGWQPRRYVEATHSLPRVAEDLVAAYESVRRRRTSGARRLRQASRTTVDLAKFRARRLASSAREGGVR